MRSPTRGKYSRLPPPRMTRAPTSLPIRATGRLSPYLDPARNASMDSPPRKSIETKDRGRTSPELYSGPFDRPFWRSISPFSSQSCW